MRRIDPHKSSDAEIERQIECYSWMWSASADQCAACLVRDRCVQRIVDVRIVDLARAKGTKVTSTDLALSECATDSASASILLAVAAGSSIGSLLPPQAQDPRAKARKSTPTTNDRHRRKTQRRVDRAVAPTFDAIAFRASWERERARSPAVAALALGQTLTKNYRGLEVCVQYCEGWVEWSGQRWPTLSSVKDAVVGLKDYPAQHGRPGSRAMTDWSTSRFFRLGLPPVQTGA
jgi:hypothetical protein